MNKLTAQAVEAMFLDCLFGDEELDKSTGKPITVFTEVEGITQRFGLHPGRLKEKESALKEMIGELNPNFTTGGGWTFLNLCENKDGKLWTGSQRRVEEFYVMCAGVGLAHFCLPREAWKVLPGSVPYIAFKEKESNEQRDTASNQTAADQKTS